MLGTLCACSNSTEARRTFRSRVVEALVIGRVDGHFLSTSDLGLVDVVVEGLLKRLNLAFPLFDTVRLFAQIFRNICLRLLVSGLAQPVRGSFD